MDMMAMAYLFDLLQKNRRWDEAFEPREPRRTTVLLRRLISAITRKRRPPETCKDCESTWPVACEGGRIK